MQTTLKILCGLLVASAIGCSNEATPPKAMSHDDLKSVKDVEVRLDDRPLKLAAHNEQDVTHDQNFVAGETFPVEVVLKRDDPSDQAKHPNRSYLFTLVSIVPGVDVPVVLTAILAGNRLDGEVHLKGNMTMPTQSGVWAVHLVRIDGTSIEDFVPPLFQSYIRIESTP